MTIVGADSILLVFIIFCRVGGCLMLMPGFSSPRVPVQVRLFVAVAVTLALAPLLLPSLAAALPNPAPSRAIALIISETVTGALIGLIGRLFYLALQFMATAAAMFVGYSTIPGMPIEDAEPLPALATFITLTATVLLFLTDQHWEIFRALLASYSAVPVTEPLAVEPSLVRVSDALSSTFTIALQISSPFVIYALLINFLVGIANKLTPQIPVYFISTPFVLAGGLFLLYFTIGESVRLFITSFASWLRAG